MRKAADSCADGSELAASRGQALLQAHSAVAVDETGSGDSDLARSEYNDWCRKQMEAGGCASAGAGATVGVDAGVIASESASAAAASSSRDDQNEPERRDAAAMQVADTAEMRVRKERRRRHREKLQQKQSSMDAIFSTMGI